MMDDTINLTGSPLTQRMLDMGITGMAQHHGAWSAVFSSYPGHQFILPPPVAEWLLAEGGK